ncbi:MAG TPA: peptidyl-prolyl cis-trans isomerase [Candidatus Polarisedimenticolaceae bacterium]|nr:peptidyl-prolyl cis-trans isomerase [Candidatus Polarisedimenticolaceae bacterium]
MDSVYRSSKASRLARRVALCTVVSMASIAAPVPAESARVLARVNGEPITIDDLYQELDNFHRTVQDPRQAVERPRVDELLDRLINARLIIQEARNIGLDELAEYAELIDGYRRGALRRMVLDRAVGGVEADPERVEQIHELLVKRYRIRGVLIESKEAAEQLERRARAGEDFERLVGELAEKLQVRPTDPEMLYRPDELFPEIVAELNKLEVGQFTPVVAVRETYAFAQLLEVRMLDDPDARAIAEDEALRVAVEQEKRAFVESRIARHAKVDRELLAGIDLGAGSANLAELKTDSRPIATIDGAEPITVGDLCTAFERQFFHGVEKVSGRDELTPRLERVLHELIGAQVTLREARALGLDQTDEFHRQVDHYANGVLFAIFVERVVEPEVEVTQVDLERYRERHIDEFTTPEMLQLDALVFDGEPQARRALDRLRNGADFDWTRVNAAGQSPAGGPAGRIPFNPQMPLTTAEMPDALRQAVADAQPGDYRFLAGSPSGPYYVIQVRNVIASQSQPLAQIADRISKPVFAEKRQQAIDEWTRELREASEVERLVDDRQLAELVGFGSAE